MQTYINLYNDLNKNNKFISKFEEEYFKLIYKNVKK